MRLPLSWLLTVFVPYVASGTCFVLIRGGGSKDFLGKIVKLGGDYCILGLGLWPALVGSTEAQTVLGLSTVKVVVAPIFIWFLLITMWARLKESRFNDVNKARISFALGTLTIGANTGLITYINHGRNLMSACFLGAVAWLTPVMILELVLRFGHFEAALTEREPNLLQ